jgi:hypothetical protein
MGECVVQPSLFKFSEAKVLFSLGPHVAATASIIVRKCKWND